MFFFGSSLSNSFFPYFAPYSFHLSVLLQIHARSMNCERDIRFELLARLCPNTTGADIRSVCIEAGMFAIRARRKTVTEKVTPNSNPPTPSALNAPPS